MRCAHSPNPLLIARLQAPRGTIGVPARAVRAVAAAVLDGFSAGEPMNELSISVVAISCNEEQNLAAFLKNVSQIASEVVIVDSGSTDRTPDIARAAGDYVRFIYHPMTKEGGFAEQRNIGIQEAQGAWILNMDCDERLSPELAGEIRATLPDSGLNGYRYRRLNYFLNRPMRHGGWGTWNRPQIARRGAHRFEGRLHESCIVEGGEAMIGQLQGLMHHLNDFDLSQRFAKSAHYTDVEAELLVAHGHAVQSRDLCWWPIREFVKKYLAQKGFRDGVPGLIAATHAATAKFRALALAWDRQNAIPRDRLEAELTSKSENRVKRR